MQSHIFCIRRIRLVQITSTWRARASHRDSSTSAAVAENIDIASTNAPFIPEDGLGVNESSGSSKPPPFTIRRGIGFHCKTLEQFRFRGKLFNKHSPGMEQGSSRNTPEATVRACDIVPQIIDNLGGIGRFKDSAQPADERFRSELVQWFREESPELRPSKTFARHEQAVRPNGSVIYDAIRLILERSLMSDARKHAQWHASMESEMLQLWHYTAQGMGTKGTISHQSLESEHTWPRIETGTFGGRTKDARWVRNGPARIGILFPNIQFRDRRSLFTMAVALFAYAMSTRLWWRNAQIRPSVKFLAKLLYKADVDEARKRILRRVTISQDTTIPVQNFIRTLESIETYLIIVIRSTEPQRPVMSVENVPTTVSELERANLLGYFVDILRRMHERGIYHYFRQTWDLAHRTYATAQLFVDNHQNVLLAQNRTASQDEVLSSHENVLPNSLYRMFLITAFRMKSIETANRIWKQMLAADSAPDVKDWTTMIYGIGSLQGRMHVAEMWQQMIKAGITPDLAAWNARMQATVRNGHIGAGLTTAVQLSEEWKSQLVTIRSRSESRDTSENKHRTAELQALKPTTRTLNALLSSVKMWNQAYIPEILRWSKSMNIQWDVHTFNKMLDVYWRSNRDSRFLNTFRRILRYQIEPDIATYNLLARHVLGISEMSTAEKMSSWISILEEIIASGLKPSVLTYAPILQELVSIGEFEAVEAILDHSKQVGKSLYAKVVAVAAKRLLAHDPPHFVLLNKLIIEMEAIDSASSAKFFNAILQGFAKLRAMHRMRTTIRTARKLGMTPTWQTLATCLEACSAISDREAAQEVLVYAGQAVANGVMDICDGPSFHLPRRRRNRFWQLAEHMELSEILEPNEAQVVNDQVQSTSNE